MNLKDVQCVEGSKSIIMSIRTTKEKHRWMSKNKVSPTKLFNVALDDVMKYVEDKLKEEDKK